MLDIYLIVLFKMAISFKTFIGMVLRGAVPFAYQIETSF